jgi:spermidine synthase
MPSAADALTGPRQHGGWPNPPPARQNAALLLGMVLVTATSGLVYELSMAAAASYLLGDSVTQFSLVIGVYLSALGLGAYLSRWIDRHLARAFVDVELGAALLGGLSAPALFLAHAQSTAFEFVLYCNVIAVGVLVGLELPLLLRILEQRLAFKELVSRALTFDYAGALLGSLAFSLLLVPHLGLVHTSLVCGLLNAGVALVSTFALRDSASHRELAQARVRALVTVFILVVCIVFGHRVTELSDAAVYPGRVVFAEESRYQRIVLTETGDSLALHLNGHLQFSSSDEARYHEALVHPALALATTHARVFIGGGGDGLAAREILKWRDVRAVTLVDLDERVTTLAKTYPVLRALNQGSLGDPRVHVINADAMRFLETTSEQFDVLVFDFPDPSNYSIGKLYSREFYRAAKARLAPGGVIVVQATSPLFARAAFWCVSHTLASLGFYTLPYHTFVPAFGEWGFVLAATTPLTAPKHVPAVPLRYLNDENLATLFYLSPDMAEIPTEDNQLNNQALVSYYVRDWSRWN